jgi:hypothetical protein
MRLSTRLYKLATRLERAGSTLRTVVLQLQTTVKRAAVKVEYYEGSNSAYLFALASTNIAAANKSRAKPPSGVKHVEPERTNAQYMEDAEAILNGH